MKIRRAAFTVMGIALVGIGLVGVFLPGLPTTIFMILALFCFKKGSARLENWLLRHRVFGPTLRDWERNHAIKRRTKVVAVTTMWVFAGLSIFIIPVLWVKLAIAAACTWVTWYIVSRKSVEDLPPHVRQASETYKGQVA
ncbi:MAG: YbaN family protein [Armatimonadetes bacterium]|nr:YbaN family protein [Armatimonadota bacterium]